MKTATLSLDVIDIANPCTEPWDNMRGDSRKRFCESCKLHVYNISELSREAAHALIVAHEERLCVRMYRRADGTVITNDCSRIRAAAKRTLRFATTAARMLLFAALAPFAINAAGCCAKDDHEVMMGAPVPLQGDIAPTTRPSTQPTTQPNEALMGKVRIDKND